MIQNVSSDGLIAHWMPSTLDAGWVVNVRPLTQEYNNFIVLVKSVTKYNET